MATLELVSVPYIPTGDINLGVFVPPEPDEQQLVAFGTRSSWGKASPVNVGAKSNYGITIAVDTRFKVTYGLSSIIDVTTTLISQQNLIATDNIVSIFNRPISNLVDLHTKLNLNRVLSPADKGYKLGFERRFTQPQSDYGTKWLAGTPQDTDYTFKHNAVRLSGVERVPIFEQVFTGYTPTSDLQLTSRPHITGTSDLSLENIGSEGEVVIGFERTPIQPVGCSFKTGFGKSLTIIDTSKTFAWGYGLNNFIVGGVTTVPSRPDPFIPPEPDPPIVHINYEVYRIVNTVNITVRPNGEALDFDNFSITRDVESFAWTCTFDLLTLESYNLVRPVGRVLKEIDININGTIFTVFVGKANTSVRAGTTGTTRVYRCTAWSNLKRLSYPYARRNSFSDTQQRTAAQIANNELTGTGFTVVWDTIDWPVPAGVHTYQNKTKLGAVLGVVNAIGGVIVPDLSTDEFTVRPYYPVSPWDWDSEFTQINRSMNESQFFSIDNDTIPRDNPNGVYVYGQEQGVGVFAVRLGTAGNELLPDVVDQYITANTAGQERGRIEVARNSFIELIPMSTYVDENGIIMPQELIEFTGEDGQLWRGMVVQTTVNCNRIGTALVQQITIARFFDG